MGRWREITKSDHIDEQTYRQIILLGMHVVSNTTVSYTELSEIQGIPIKEIDRIAGFLNIKPDNLMRWYFSPQFLEKGEKPVPCYDQYCRMITLFVMMEAGFVWDNKIRFRREISRNGAALQLYPRFCLAINNFTLEAGA